MEQTKWQAKEIATAKVSQAAILAAEDRFVRIQKFNEATARKASEAHEKAISDLTHQYDAARAAGGLGIDRAICASQTHGPAAATGAGGSDKAAAGTVPLPPDVEAKFLQLSQEADALAERLRSLQKWVRKTGLYGPEG